MHDRDAGLRGEGGLGAAEPSFAQRPGHGGGLDQLAFAQFGAGRDDPLARAFVGADSPASSEVTGKVLGWEPAHPGLIEDLEDGHYFGRG